jgi:UDP-N-acetylglucosamine--N-acetylmuramyl-(pentapeptide) pyrophosphoryl-undecaprenol N-acetylglucosamine transferase
MKPLKVIISGGGTGGHIFPALAIANKIRERKPEAQILFVGANGRMEMEKVPQAGYEIKGLNIAGFQRGALLKNVALPFKLIDSFLSALAILYKFKPTVAIGVGGYASGPLLQMASLLSVPTVIQEQNSFAGVTNKILSKKAKVVCTAYEGMERVFVKAKVVMTGNPVRAEIVNRKNNRDAALMHFNLEATKKTILIIGGSLGARTLNQSVETSIDRISEGNVQVLWQTGKIYFEDCQRLAEGNKNLKVYQFIDRMDLAYDAADIVISRAGALSIAELQLVGKPVILVPSPNVAEDHQTHNAMALVNKHAALMVKDDEARLNLIGLAYDLLANQKLQDELSKNIKAMAIADASDRIVDEIFKICAL